MLEAHYRVCRADGIRFADSSEIQEGLPVAISTADLEPGWVEGMAGMALGEKRRLWVPAVESAKVSPQASRQLLVIYRTPLADYL